MRFLPAPAEILTGTSARPPDDPALDAAVAGFYLSRLAARQDQDGEAS